MLIWTHQSGRLLLDYSYYVYDDQFHHNQLALDAEQTTVRRWTVLSGVRCRRRTHVAEISESESETGCVMKMRFVVDRVGSRRAVGVEIDVAERSR